MLEGGGMEGRKKRMWWALAPSRLHKGTLLKREEGVNITIQPGMHLLGGGEILE